MAVEVKAKQVGGPGPLESLTGSVVDLVSDLGELFGSDRTQVGAFGEVVAQQAVGRSYVCQAAVSAWFERADDSMSR